MSEEQLISIMATMLYCRPGPQNDFRKCIELAKAILTIYKEEFRNTAETRIE